MQERPQWAEQLGPVPEGPVERAEWLQKARTEFAEAARSIEQLDRADAVLGEALLDLPRLLAGVHVHDRSSRSASPSSR